MMSVGSHAIRPAGNKVKSGIFMYNGIPDNGNVAVYSTLYLTALEISSHCIGA